VQAYDTFQRNFWNRTYVGNYWSDFSSNSGYPYNYTLPGSGYSVDYWPVGKAVNCTIPYGGMVITQNTTFCPGTYKINGTIIVGYGITLGCKDTVLLGDRSFAGLDTSSMSTIKNCKLINFSSGYSGMHRSLNSFINNTIINPSYYAFQLHDEYNSTFINNTILDCTTGGFRIWWGSNYNKFLGNNIKNCSGTSETSGAFFFDWYSDYNLFINNNLRDNYKAFNLPDTWYSVHYNNSFINNTLFNNNFGFYLGSSVGADIEGNNITNSSWYGIFSDYSSGNSIHNNLFNDNYIGVYLTSSNNTEIYDNYISFSSYYNVYLSQSTNNTVYHNNLFNNRTKQAYEQLGFNYWDYYQEGNYWSDYDEDIEGCIDANADGICDLPYNISGGINKDNYPFKKSNYWFNKSLLMINISEGWNLFSPMLMPKDANTNRTIALNKGWNLIGYSSTKAFNWSKAIIKNSTGAEKDTISAGTANWIQSTIYYFNETSKSYVSVTYNNMTSKRGYWVYALKENLTLIFPNVGGSLFGPAFDWIKTSVNNGSLIKSISDSESSGWLQSTLYYYDKSYKFVPGDDSNVYPWRGYWIYSNKNLTLIIQ
jgi:parallel beta-helix repeat protein